MNWLKKFWDKLAGPKAPEEPGSFLHPRPTPGLGPQPRPDNPSNKPFHQTEEEP